MGLRGLGSFGAVFGHELSRIVGVKALPVVHSRLPGLPRQCFAKSTIGDVHLKGTYGRV